MLRGPKIAPAQQHNNEPWFTAVTNLHGNHVFVIYIFVQPDMIYTAIYMYVCADVQYFLPGRTAPQVHLICIVGRLDAFRFALAPLPYEYE